MSWSMVGMLIGGIGLFLLGMRMMTDGLKLAAGHTLRNTLSRGTRTPLRGLISGFAITSLVQSSSAVTVATIGFVNAGLMKLQQAVVVIYGSNIGTTMTGWLVALTGFHVNIKLFALPAVGLGMLLHLLGGERRFGTLGLVLAGFGVFFFGIDVLKSGFANLGAAFELGALVSEGLLGLLTFVAIGFLLTMLMQSSSAAMAITLTATAGNIIPLEYAAAIVIGTNVGTTSTAALAVIGATPNAKRVAAAHVIFNLVTALVAFLLLSPLLGLIVDLLARFDFGSDPMTTLALFHTLFNILGVALLWLLTPALVRFLKHRFRSVEEDEAKPRYLDKNILATPLLAMHALTKELQRVCSIARRIAMGSISSEAAPGLRSAADRGVLNKLIEATGNFSNKIQRLTLPQELDEVLPNALRVSRYALAISELSEELAQGQSRRQEIGDPLVSDAVTQFKSGVVKLLGHADIDQEAFSIDALAAELEGVESDYQQLKSQLLRAGTEERLPLRQTVDLLEQLSHVRRIAEQSEKAASYLLAMRLQVVERQDEGGDAVIDSEDED